MTTHATVTFSLKAWDEKPYNEVPGELKMTRSSIAYVYHGDIEGESTLDYLMVYREDGSGSFVLQHTGTFNKSDVNGTCMVVPRSGTSELASLRGEGEISLSGHAEQYPMTFNYNLD